MFTRQTLYRSLHLFLQADVLGELWPWHAADHGWHAAITGGGCVGFGELQWAGCQVDLCSRTGHGVDAVDVFLTL